MKLVFLISPILLIFASCAPKATIVEEAPTPKPKEEKATETTDLKLPPKDNLGLLDPPRLTTMPTQKDMKPTIKANNEGSSTVIATPGENKTTDE